MSEITAERIATVYAAVYEVAVKSFKPPDNGSSFMSREDGFVWCVFSDDEEGRGQFISRYIPRALSEDLMFAAGGMVDALAKRDIFIHTGYTTINAAAWIWPQRDRPSATGETLAEAAFLAAEATVTALTEPASD